MQNHGYAKSLKFQSSSSLLLLFTPQAVSAPWDHQNGAYHVRLNFLHIIRLKFLNMEEYLVLLRLGLVVDLGKHMDIGLI